MGIQGIPGGRRQAVQHVGPRENFKVMSATYGQHNFSSEQAMGVHQGFSHHAEGLKMTRTPEERRIQFARANRHRYLVLVLRVLLPVLGVATASLYFLGPALMTNVEIDLGPAKATIGRIDVSPNSLKMLNPRMQGFDEKQGAYVVEADQAVQDIKSPHVIHLERIRARVDHPDRKVSRLTARRGVFDSQKETLKLSGDIRGRLNGEMTIAMSKAFINMKRKTVESDAPVTAAVVNGTLTSDTMFADTNQRLLVFKGRVRLVIKSLRKPAKPVLAEGTARGTGATGPDRVNRADTNGADRGGPGKGDLRQ